MNRVLAALALAALWMLFVGILSGVVHAQESMPELDVALARVCVAEAGWTVIQTGECAAIYDVVRMRAKRRGVSEERALRDYAANHFDAGRSSRPWVAGLTARAEQPRGWPTRLRWDRYRPQWVRTIAHAGKVLRGEVASPCAGRVDHWGGAMDDARARRAGLERVHCSSAVRNRFWRLPRRDAARGEGPRSAAERGQRGPS